MRILFVPCPGAVFPHAVPLIALNTRLEAGRHETAFLVPRNSRDLLTRRHLKVLDIDYAREQQFRSEMLACGNFRPDVIVDDMSPTALLTATLSNKPRVSIRRTGDFPSRPPSDPTYSHSSGTLDFEQYYRHIDAVCGMPAPGSLADICQADMHIVPGIGSVEVLPASLRDDPQYVFAGGLVIPDAVDSRARAVANEVGAFCERNRPRKIVFVTLGTVIKPDSGVGQVIRTILDGGAAVISTVNVPDLRTSSRETFFYASFLPMSVVCSRADLMIHHCGANTYQYAIRHAIPSICLGSRSYDRDDVAKRLDALGAAKYIPLEDGGYVDSFRRCFGDCIDAASPWYRLAKESLESLRDEDSRTAAAFDFEATLEKAVSRHREAKSAPHAVESRTHLPSREPVATATDHRIPR